MGRACWDNNGHVIYVAVSPVVGFLFRNRLCISGVLRSKTERLMVVYIRCIFRRRSVWQATFRLHALHNALRKSAAITEIIDVENLFSAWCTEVKVKDVVSHRVGELFVFPSDSIEFAG